MLDTQADLAAWWALPFEQRVELERALLHIVWFVYGGDKALVRAWARRARDLNTALTVALARLAEEQINEAD